MTYTGVVNVQAIVGNEATTKTASDDTTAENNLKQLENKTTYLSEEALLLLPGHTVVWALLNLLMRMYGST